MAAQVGRNQVESGDYRKSNGLRVVVALACVLAVIAVGVAVVGFFSAQSTQSQDKKLRSGLTALGSRLNGELAAAEQQLSAAQTAISTLKANSQTGAVTGLRDQIGKLVVCLPELQQEINGLNVNTSNTSGYLTNAFLTNPTIISSNCSKLLNGS